MPKPFDNCVTNGGKVITKKVNATQYMHICYLNGKDFPGDIKNYKKIKGLKNNKKAKREL